MTSTNQWTDPTWTVVHADLDIAHVMLPLGTFKLRVDTEAAEYPTFLVDHSYQAPVPDCFAGVSLVARGQGELQLKGIDGLAGVKSIAESGTLRPYNKDSAEDYIRVIDAMGSYLTQHSKLNRLEGIIRIPCHWHGAPLKDYKPAISPHAPVWVKTTIQLYLVTKAVDAKSPLLVVRTPLSPACPMNGDGTAIIVGKD
jgi:hypothetical protein